MPAPLNQTQWTPRPSTNGPSWDALCNDLCGPHARNGVCEDSTSQAFFAGGGDTGVCASGTDCSDCGRVDVRAFRPPDCSDGLGGDVRAGLPCFFPWREPLSNSLVVGCGVKHRDGKRWCPLDIEGHEWATCTPGKCSYAVEAPTVEEVEDYTSLSPTTLHTSAPTVHHHPRDDSVSPIVAGTVAVVLLCFVVLAVFVRVRRALSGGRLRTSADNINAARGTAARGADEDHGVELEYRAM